MANFKASFTNLTTGKPDISLINGSLVINDNSNYNTNTEQGHFQAAFATYRKLKVTSPNGTTYLFSSLYPTDNSDALTKIPWNNTLPLSDSFPIDKDGGYVITLYTVPTWGLVATYIGTPTNPVCVYGLGTDIHSNPIPVGLYKTITTTSQVPGYGNDWVLLASEDDLTSKYKLTIKIATVCNLINAYQQSLLSLTAKLECGGCGKEFTSSIKFQNTAKLLMIKESIPVLLNKGNISQVNNLINEANQICVCAKIITSTTYDCSGYIYLQGLDQCGNIIV